MKQTNIRIDSRTREEIDDSVDLLNRYRTSIFHPFEDGVNSFPWHWHSEVECFYVQEGSLIYHIPGKECVFNQGDVGFVNSGVLHMLTTSHNDACRIQNHIFLPHMICGDSGSIETKYVSPLIQNTAASMLVFRAETETAEKMRKWMDEAHNSHIKKDFACELSVRDCMSRIWALLVSQMPPSSKNDAGKESVRMMAMIEYISRHYSEKITLDALASATHISTKECERCFLKQIKITPFEYIMDYRLEKARIMLRQDRENSITKIGQSCGFATTSYFGKCFKTKYGMSPGEYRKNNSEAKNYENS